MYKDFFIPENSQDNFKILNNLDGKFSYYAGGITINWRGTNSDYLISLEKIINKTITEKNDIIEIGAGIKLSELQKLNNTSYSEIFKGLVKAAEFIASPQIRNMATLGGNLISQFDFSDTLGFIYLLKPDIKIINENGPQTLKFNEFYNDKTSKFSLPYKTILNSFEFKKTELEKYDYSDFIKESRVGRDISTISVTVLKNKSDSKFSIAIGSYWLNTECFYEIETIDSVFEIIKNKPDPKTDVRASSEYRKKILKYLIETAVFKNNY